MSLLAEALARWQHAAGAYWPYVCAAPFLADELVPRAARPRRVPDAGRLVRAIQDLPPDARPAVFVDLPPTRTLPATPELVRAGFVVVPVIQRWVTASAVLNGQPLVDHLVHYSRTLRRRSAERGVVFLLDGDRQGPDRPRRTSARAFDNRYRYSSDRFPPASFLRARGIDSLRWISRGGLADDVREYLVDASGELAVAPLQILIAGQDALSSADALEADDRAAARDEAAEQEAKDWIEAHLDEARE